MNTIERLRLSIPENDHQELVDGLAEASDDDLTRFAVSIAGYFIEIEKAKSEINGSLRLKQTSRAKIDQEIDELQAQKDQLPEIQQRIIKKAIMLGEESQRRRNGPALQPQAFRLRGRYEPDRP